MTRPDFSVKIRLKFQFVNEFSPHKQAKKGLATTSVLLIFKTSISTVTLNYSELPSGGTVVPRINDLTQPDDPRRVERSGARRSEEVREETRTEAAGDRIEVSNDAKRAQELQSRLAEEARNAPEIREDRVAEARARLEAGEYDSEAVRETIANRLLDQFGI